MTSESRTAHIACLKARIMNAQTVEEINYLWAEVEALKASNTWSASPLAQPYVHAVTPAPQQIAPSFQCHALPPAPPTPAEHALKHPCDFSNLSRTNSTGSLSTAADNSTRRWGDFFDSPPPSPGSQQDCFSLENSSEASPTQASAGGSDADDDDWEVLSSDRHELSVRNTFIDFKRERAPSLDDFFIERRVHSCPASRKGSMDEAENDLASDAHSESTALEAEAECSSTSCTEQHTDSWSSSRSTYTSCNVTHAEGNDAELTVLRLAEALQPEVQAAEFLSSGSLQHGNGKCRPCVFFPSKGCSSGRACAFCHICTPLSRKEKKAILKGRKATESRR